MRPSPSAENPAFLRHRRRRAGLTAAGYNLRRRREKRALRLQRGRVSSPRPEGHPTVEHGRVGVLLVNLGTPEATDYWSMRRYLKEFLSDRRVIETPRWLWRPILNLIILTRRPSVQRPRL